LFPSLDATYPWVIPLVWFGFILFGFLVAMKVVSAYLTARGL